MQNDTEKLKALLFSNDKANFDLALSLAESQKNQEISDLYQKMTKLHHFWSEQIMQGYPKEIDQMIPFFERNGLNFFKNYTLREIPFENELLIPYIKSFYVWYTSLHSLPKGLGMFENIEKIEVSSAPLTHIGDEIWKLPKLKELNVSIGKNFQWESNVLYANALEILKVSGVVYPSLPSELSQLPELRFLGYRALGSPKDAVELPAVIWDCKKLEEMDLFGKTIICPSGENFEKLPSLRKLNISYINWTELPESLSKAESLQSLTISTLIKLKKLPDWLATLPIESLEIRGCKLSNALEIIEKMPNLKVLKISAVTQKKVDASQWQSAFGHINLQVF